MTIKELRGVSLEKVRMRFEFSARLSAELERVAVSSGLTKTEVLRRGLALMRIAVDARGRGRRLALVDAQRQMVTDVSGVLRRGRSPATIRRRTLAAR